MHLIGWLNDDVKDYSVAKKAAEFGVKVAAVSSHSFTPPTDFVAFAAIRGSIPKCPPMFSNATSI